MGSKLISFLIVCAVIPSTAQKNKAAQPPVEVEITSEPSHHLAFENSYVRVFQVQAGPRSATLMHRHRHDYVFVTLGDSEVSNEVEGKPPVTLKLHDGETRFTPGDFAHRVRNLADTPFRNVTIEFLRDEKESSSKWDEERGLHVLHGGTQEVLFVKDGVRVSGVELQIAGVLPKHHHAGPRLVVAVTDLVFRNDVVGKPTSNIEMKSGDVEWLEGGMTHTITNVGTREAKFVVLEF
jgi:quercetin dioxygenase-like cupin family protein